MPVVTARTISLQGALGHLIDVQVDVSQGVVATTLVGRPDAAITEGRDRCRMAVQNSGFAWPTTRRTTILLSPADVPKSGPHFDLAMAVGVIWASAKQSMPALDGTVFIGELTLDGRMRPVHGVLPMTMAAAARGMKRVFVPEPQAREARMVPDVEVLGVRSLGQVVALLCRRQVPDAPEVEPLSGNRLLTWRGQAGVDRVDLAEVSGMPDARYALEVAAAGGHHLLLTGPRGSGKTTLAERLPGILPDLTTGEALELAAIHSLAGILDPGSELPTRPPFCAPHSSSSRTSLLGGGTGKVRPGEISRAHCGVLFLDEFPLFSLDIVEALRQPLESGELTLGRGDESVTFPARGMVVLAANPCPCGDFTPDPGTTCECSEVDRRHYRRKLSGPIVDRVDITRHVAPMAPAQPPQEGHEPWLEPAESTADVRRRVEVARARQLTRYAEHQWRTNGQAPGPRLVAEFPLAEPARRLLDKELWAGRLTRRGVTRVHRVAWTVADLAGLDRPGVPEVEVALRLRAGQPLELETLRRHGIAG